MSDAHLHMHNHHSSCTYFHQHIFSGHILLDIWQRDLPIFEYDLPDPHAVSQFQNVAGMVNITQQRSVLLATSYFLKMKTDTAHGMMKSPDECCC